jgi:hypothetical protein
METVPEIYGQGLYAIMLFLNISLKAGVADKARGTVWF